MGWGVNEAGRGYSLAVLSMEKTQATHTERYLLGCEATAPLEQKKT